MSDTKRDIVDEISDEKLRELDSWYAKWSSNSLVFCNDDYLAMRARLRRVEAERDAARSENVEITATLREAESALLREGMERDAALAERDRLKTALEFYASPDAWTQNALEGNHGNYGNKAREALAAVAPRDGKGAK